MANQLPFALHGACAPESLVKGKNFRIAVLTSRLLRLEYSETGCFEDRPTQFAINREFPVPQFSVYDTGSGLELQTEHLSLYYDKKSFSAGGLSIKVRSRTAGIYSTWHFGDVLDENLWGTARTLDQANGAIPLETGLQSRLQGFSVIDDSHSIVLLENGWFAEREGNCKDLYFFGYGLEYQTCLDDFFHLSGATPLLPRWALGNWWSRFYPYHADEYLRLMDRFAQEEIPLSVAVIDMDWHLTDVAPTDGKGWTGYTWNRQLFPNPGGFLEALHQRGLKVSLNDHPAEGIQPYEERYPQACAGMGLSEDENRPIPFDFTSPAYVRTYFEQILHPLEREGVDLWWVDWQQGGSGRFRTSDPLLLLNHYHFWNQGRNGNRPMTFSRYAGPGSHRYPIGFSGDSIISWASLDFQPFFTACAANIGYGWWSHDIGGHCAGRRDEELLIRWVQFGVFSPIMRLHSTSNLFNSKEPWNFSEPACGILKALLRLRHRLIPYLYTANWRCHQEGLLLVRPMYYSWPEQSAAYEVPNQYEFGSELLVCPITTPMDQETLLGRVTAWLPEEQYFDFFTGLRYQGKRKINLYRPIEQIPVLAPAGAIVPLAQEDETGRNRAELPTKLEVRIFCGKSGRFELYEDDGETMAYQEGRCAITTLELCWDEANMCCFRICPGETGTDLLPEKRQYMLSFVGIPDTSQITVASKGNPATFTRRYDQKTNALVVELPVLDSSQRIEVCFSKCPGLAHNSILSRAFDLLNKMHIDYEAKERIYRCISEKHILQSSFSELQTMNLSEAVLGALSELLFAE